MRISRLNCAGGHLHILNCGKGEGLGVCDATRLNHTPPPKHTRTHILFSRACAHAPSLSLLLPPSIVLSHSFCHAYYCFPSPSLSLLARGSYPAMIEVANGPIQRDRQVSTRTLSHTLSHSVSCSTSFRLPSTLSPPRPDNLCTSPQRRSIDQIVSLSLSLSRSLSHSLTRSLSLPSSFSPTLSPHQSYAAIYAEAPRRAWLFSRALLARAYKCATRR